MDAYYLLATETLKQYILDTFKISTTDIKCCVVAVERLPLIRL